jgi:hypothetical protein
MKFYLCTNTRYDYHDEWVEFNYEQFLRYHTINNKPSMIPKIMENRRREEEKKRIQHNRKIKREIERLRKEIERIKKVNKRKEKERKEYLKAMGGRDVSGIRPIPKMKNWMKEMV